MGKAYVFDSTLHKLVYVDYLHELCQWDTEQIHIEKNIVFAIVEKSHPKTNTMRDLYEGEDIYDIFENIQSGGETVFLYPEEEEKFFQENPAIILNGGWQDEDVKWYSVVFLPQKAGV